MAKAISSFEKPKVLEDIFKSLASSNAKINLLTKALQKYQNMTPIDYSVSLRQSRPTSQISSNRDSGAFHSKDSSSDSNRALKLELDGKKKRKKKKEKRKRKEKRKKRRKEEKRK